MKGCFIFFVCAVVVVVGDEGFIERKVSNSKNMKAKAMKINLGSAPIIFNENNYEPLLPKPTFLPSRRSEQTRPPGQEPRRPVNVRPTSLPRVAKRPAQKATEKTNSGVTTKPSQITTTPKTTSTTNTNIAGSSMVRTESRPTTGGQSSTQSPAILPTMEPLIIDGSGIFGFQSKSIYYNE